MLQALRVFDFDSPDRPGEALQRRVIEAFVLLECLAACLVWARYIEHVDVIAHPLGIARHVPLDFMLDGRVPWLNAVAIGLLLALGFSRRVRWAYAAALSLMLFQYGARYSIGEIPHGANLIGMCLLGFGLGPLLYAERREAERFTFGFVALAISIGYVSAAVCKFVASGITWPLGEHLASWIYNKAADSFAKSGHFELNPLQRFLVDNRLAATLFLCVGWLTELGSAFVLHRRLRPWALWALVGLHLGIGVVLEIWFRSATLTLALLGLPASLFARVESRLWGERSAELHGASLTEASHVQH